MKLACALVIAFLFMSASGSAADLKSPCDGWDFKFKDFLIGAWLGPAGTDAEVQVYKECNFNTVMVGRYMFSGGRDQWTKQAKDIGHHLDLAHKHGLGAFIDLDHFVPPGKFAWMHGLYGEHPALIGYQLADDQWDVSDQCEFETDFLRKNAPHLMPWICGMVPAEALAKAGNPFMNHQMYPTLYNRKETAERQAQIYCDLLRGLRQDCLKHDLVMWPMFNVHGVDSDSLIRFQVYSSLAYGSQAIWYFTYRSVAVPDMQDQKGLTEAREGSKGRESLEVARSERRPPYFDVQECNGRVLAWGPKLVGRTATEIYSTGFELKGDDHFPPSSGKLVEKMSDDLLLGILAKEGSKRLAMVVDKRVSKERGAISPREVEIRFSSAIGGINIIDGKTEKRVNGNLIKLTLPGGGGQLLELD